MTSFPALASALADLIGAGTRDAGFSWRTVGANQLQVAVEPGDVRAVAAALRERFGAELSMMVADDGRRWSGSFHVHYLFAQPAENWFVHATVSLPPDEPRIASLASFHYPASRFEREISDMFGIRVDGHPDPRPLVRHGFWPETYYPLRKDASVPPLVDDGRGFPFGQVAGEGVFEIPVGPVHAGVIEPGHFRFSVVGETIIDMKSRLYYTHKGVEKLFEGQAPAEAVRLAERISGDTMVGHALAYCQAVEATAGVEVPPRARFLRTALLELERLHNHVADFGMIANDTGFAVAQSHCARIREGLLALNKRWTGSRLLRGAVVPGGTTVDWPEGIHVTGELGDALADFRSVVDICLANTLLEDRLEGTGRLFAKTARDHGVLGYVGRASGVDRDVRRDHPFAAYRDVSFRVPVFTSGDVRARALVRVEEAIESVSIIRQVAELLPPGPYRVALPQLPPLAPAFSLVEGWRGAITHWVMADEDGRLERVKVVDPSFLNWRPLSYALLGNIVPDFPLCNKSFNQSYSGNDL
jgi:Ni,Fe-hydrogenase III large subunit/Ni,Fe-hydrogenase III component G